MRNFISIVEAAERDFSPEFKRWFGQSKVVDKNGQPMIMYHGTRSEINFDFMKEFTHFGTVDAANERIGLLYDGTSHMYPVYLSIQHPLQVEDNWGDSVIGIVFSILETLEVIDPTVEKLIHHEIFDTDTKFSEEEKSKIVDIEIASGDKSDGISKLQRTVKLMRKHIKYDGLCYYNYYEGSGELSWIIFDPSQCKSIWNSGKWNPTSRNMSESHND